LVWKLEFDVLGFGRNAERLMYNKWSLEFIVQHSSLIFQRSLPKLQNVVGNVFVEDINTFHTFQFVDYTYGDRKHYYLVHGLQDNLGKH
jgi:hypothetical protein